MKQIKLTQGQYALVDDEDYEDLNKQNWCVAYTNVYRAVGYSKRVNGERTTIHMSRVIMNAKKGEMVDHRNHNTLDNRKNNLRICTNSQNQMNSLPQENGASKYKGVHWRKNRKHWMARIMVSGKEMYIGSFDNEISACHAYDEKAKELFGKFAYLNFEGEKV